MLKRKLKASFPALLVLLGMALVLYPMLATLKNNVEQNKIVDKYHTEIQNLQSKGDSKAVTQMLEAAHKYNRDLKTGPIFDPFLKRVIPNTPQWKSYKKELSLTPVMGRIIIPGIKVNLPIYHGTSDDILNKGVGHLFGSALPVGGTGSHSILTAHTGLSTATLFDDLGKVKVNDSFYIEVAGSKAKYVVKDIRVVLPDQTDSLKAVPGQDLVTLITCTPYAVNTHRLLVTGEVSPIDEKEFAQATAQSTPSPWRWWMLISLAICLGALVIFFVVLWRKRRRNENPSPDATPGPDNTSSPQPQNTVTGQPEPQKIPVTKPDSTSASQIENTQQKADQVESTPTTPKPNMTQTDTGNPTATSLNVYDWLANRAVNRAPRHSAAKTEEN